ncbi:MAG: TolB family protein [Candidatus Sericytochromatia bacterium]
MALALSACVSERPLIYSSLQDGNWEVYLWQRGQEPVNLSAYPAIDRDAELSPDGRRLAFCSHRDNDAEIYLMERDGSNVTRLTREPYPDRQPRWSPDARHLLVVSERADKNEELWLLPIEGGAPRRLTQDPAADYDPAWFPDGRALVFISERRGRPELWRLDLSDGSSQLFPGLDNLTGRVRQPAISPDGRWLALIHESAGNPELVLHSLKGGPLRWPVPHAGFDAEPTWRDGETLIWSSARGGQGVGLFELQLSTGVIKALPLAGQMLRQPRF